jgi:hypothetical protein
MVLAGCSATTGPGAHAGEAYMVNVPRSLFYSYGPAQASGPDYSLGKGQRLVMLSYEYGYSHVAIVGTGQSGYVPTGDLVPAPPMPSPTPALALVAERSHHRHGPDSRPPTAEEQGRIPLPEFPESKPPPDAPSFRY